jgi:hypothetical protein
MVVWGWALTALAAEYPDVVPLLAADALERRADEVAAGWPTAAQVRLYPTGRPYQIELAGPWVERTSARRWERLMRRHGMPVDHLERIDGVTDSVVLGDGTVRIQIDGERATLTDWSPLPSVPPPAEVDREVVAAELVGRSYTVRWRCTQPVSVGCGEEPPIEVRTVTLRDVTVWERVVGLCVEGAMEVRRVIEAELRPTLPDPGSGWAEHFAPRRRTVDGITGEDLTGRPSIPDRGYPLEPCR